LCGDHDGLVDHYSQSLCSDNSNQRFFDGYYILRDLRNPLLGRAGQMKTEDDAKFIRVVQLQERLDEVALRFLAKLMRDDGQEVSLSIATNLAVNLLAFSLQILDDVGVEQDDYMHLVLKRLVEAYEHDKAENKTVELIAKAKQGAGGGDTCRPLH
jgi:hypothetical protein